jgi:hypothetical protein
MKSLETRIGIVGFDEALVGQVDFFEIDVKDVVLQEPVITRPRAFDVFVSANYFYFRRESPSPLLDRVNTLIEKCNAAQAQACVLKLNPSFFEAQTLDEVIRPFEKLWQKQCTLPLRIDLPAEFPQALSLLPNFITDPIWAVPKKTHHWKLHGWSEARWTRRYSEDALRKLAVDCIKFKPKTLTFGHSQRVAQVHEFLRMTS